MPDKKNVAFVTGGYSTEAVISYKSAITIENNLDRDKYNIYKIDITPQGWWYETGDQKTAVDRNDFTISRGDKKIKFDAVFIGIHGTPGEDGKLQGYFDLMNLPYTSCDAATSALTFNKRYTVAVAAFAGIGVAKSLHLFKHTSIDNTEILKRLQLPVFVKPNNGGSSIGMSKVSKGEDLAAALEKAFKEDLLNKASENFDEAVTRKGAHIMPDLFLSRGVCYLDKGDPQTAKKEFLAELDEASELPYSEGQQEALIAGYYNLAVAEERRGHSKEALSWIKLAEEEQDKLGRTVLPEITTARQKLESTAPTLP